MTAKMADGIAMAEINQHPGHSGFLRTMFIFRTAQRLVQLVLLLCGQGNLVMRDI